jgi:hypothetical protein
MNTNKQEETNNSSKCCDKCHDVYFTDDYPVQRALDSCINLACFCHTSPKEVSEEVTQDSHIHCWKQGIKPDCGLLKKKHEQCCICGLKCSMSVRLGYDALYQKEWRERNRDKLREYNRRARAIVRVAALKAYGGDSPSCKCCGTTIQELLCVDHINGGGNEHRRKIFKLRKRPGELTDQSAGYPFLYWLKNNNYPPEFQLLCHNCNFFKTAHKGKVCPCKSAKAQTLADFKKRVRGLKIQLKMNDTLENIDHPYILYISLGGKYYAQKFKTSPTPQKLVEEIEIGMTYILQTLQELE